MPESRHVSLYTPYIQFHTDARGEHFVVVMRVPPTVQQAPLLALTDFTDNWQQANRWIRRIRRLSGQMLVERHMIDRDLIMRELRCAGLADPLPKPPQPSVPLPRRNRGALNSL